MILIVEGKGPMTNDYAAAQKSHESDTNSIVAKSSDSQQPCEYGTNHNYFRLFFFICDLVLVTTSTEFRSTPLGLLPGTTVVLLTTTVVETLSALLDVAGVVV